MASSFELCDEQPKVCRHRASNLKGEKKALILLWNCLCLATSYQNLFGAPVGRSRPRYRRETRAERQQPVRRCRPLSVNTLTGAIIGAQEQNNSQPQPRPHYKGDFNFLALDSINLKNSYSSPKIPRWKPQWTLVRRICAGLWLITSGEHFSSCEFVSILILWSSTYTVLVTNSSLLMNRINPVFIFVTKKINKLCKCQWRWNQFLWNCPVKLQIGIPKKHARKSQRSLWKGSGKAAICMYTVHPIIEAQRYILKSPQIGLNVPKE